RGRSDRPCFVPPDVDEVGAFLGEVVEGPILPVAHWDLEAEERDRDLALERARDTSAISFSGIDCARETMSVQHNI
ncbi:MAG TPA: hypothetical protein PKL26_01455, partial [Methanolinea sp.]|nr:hypothetical protein [Methanolinea sp.]